MVTKKKEAKENVFDRWLGHTFEQQEKTALKKLEKAIESGNDSKVSDIAEKSPSLEVAKRAAEHFLGEKLLARINSIYEAQESAKVKAYYVEAVKGWMDKEVEKGNWGSLDLVATCFTVPETRQYYSELRKLHIVMLGQTLAPLTEMEDLSVARRAIDWIMREPEPSTMANLWGLVPEMRLPAARDGVVMATTLAVDVMAADGRTVMIEWVRDNCKLPGIREYCIRAAIEAGLKIRDEEAVRAEEKGEQWSVALDSVWASLDEAMQMLAKERKEATDAGLRERLGRAAELAGGKYEALKLQKELAEGSIERGIEGAWARAEGNAMNALDLRRYILSQIMLIGAEKDPDTRRLREARSELEERRAFIAEREALLNAKAEELPEKERETLAMLEGRLAEANGKLKHLEEVKLLIKRREGELAAQELLPGQVLEIDAKLAELESAEAEGLFPGEGEAEIARLLRAIDRAALAEELKEMHPNAQADGILATIDYVARMVAKGKGRGFFEKMVSNAEKGGNADEIRGAEISRDCFGLVAPKAREAEIAALQEKRGGLAGALAARGELVARLADDRDAVLGLQGEVKPEDAKKLQEMVIEAKESIALMRTKPKAALKPMVEALDRIRMEADALAKEADALEGKVSEKRAMPLSLLIALSLRQTEAEVLTRAIRSGAGVLESAAMVKPDVAEASTYMLRVLGEEVEKQFGSGHRPLIELLQNAIDAKPSDHEGGYMVDMLADETGVTVRDMGKAMTLENIITELVVPYSGGEEKKGYEKYGRFGVGFLSNLQYCLGSPKVSVEVDTCTGQEAWRVKFWSTSKEIKDLMVSIQRLDHTKLMRGTSVKIGGIKPDVKALGDYIREYCGFIDWDEFTIRFNKAVANNMHAYQDHEFFERRVDFGKGLGGKVRLGIVKSSKSIFNDGCLRYHQGFFVRKDYVNKEAATCLIDLPKGVDLAEQRDGFVENEKYYAAMRAVLDMMLEFADKSRGDADLMDGLRTSIGEMIARVWIYGGARDEKKAEELIKMAAERIFEDGTFVVSPGGSDYKDNLLDFCGESLRKRIYVAQEMWGHEAWKRVLRGEEGLFSEATSNGVMVLAREVKGHMSFNRLENRGEILKAIERAEFKGNVVLVEGDADSRNPFLLKPEGGSEGTLYINTSNRLLREDAFAARHEVLFRCLLTLRKYDSRAAEDEIIFVAKGAPAKGAGTERKGTAADVEAAEKELLGG